MYDAYFAESFTRADIERNSYNSIDLYDLIGNEISSGLKSDSIWANMFFDHAKFYYENASFNKRIGRVLEVTQSLETSYDLIFLSKKLSEAKTLLRDYISNTQMNDYSSGDTLIDVKYTQTTDFSQYLLFAILVLSVVLIGLIILLGISSRTQEHKFTYDSRKEKLKTVLNNLDVAFSQKKISDAEYFFMKKRYEDEIRHRPNIKEQRKRLNLSLEDLRAKQRALEKGLFDLKRHFQSGLIIPEDYERNMRQVRNEIGEIKAEIKQTQQELREERRLDSPISLLSKKIFGEKVKGTEELVDEEKEEEKEEKVKRKKVLKKFAYKKK
jgi:HAMP domain-containing protein